MKTILRILMLTMLPFSCLIAEPVSLVQAAELATKYMETGKIDGRKLQELFSITSLRSVPAPETIEASTVIWRADLEETKLVRTDPAMQLILIVDGKKYRRVLEIRHDQTVVLGKFYAEPRQRVVVPRVVPKRMPE